MSKYSNRINKLTVKTHNFISYANQSLVRDYYLALFEESEKHEDFDKIFNEFLELKTHYEDTRDKETEEKIDVIKKSHRAVIFKYLYQSAASECEKHPNGTWQPKIFTDYFLTIISDAKRYFRTEKRENY